MANQFNVHAFIVRKYKDTVYDVLCDKGKWFNKYISIPINDHLQKDIDQFHELITVYNICGAIDSTHISLSSQQENDPCNDYFFE